MQIRRNCHYRKSRNTCLVRFIVETLLGYERCGYFGVPFPKYAQFSVRFHHRDEGGASLDDSGMLAVSPLSSGLR